MTLNVTVLTLSCVFQSADYRLSNPKTGKPLPDPSTKIINLRFKNWSALVTYAGIGRALGSRGTAFDVANWFRGKTNLTFDAAIELLVERSNSAYESINIPHSFVVAAIVNGHVKAAVISNFQFRHDTTGWRTLGFYKASFITPRREPQVIITGIPHALDKMDRIYLKNIIKQYSNDKLRIRLAIAHLNQKGAERHPNTISPDCYVQDLDIYGRGHGEAIGTSRTRPEMISFGEDERKIIEPLLEKMFGIGKSSLISRTTTSSKIPPLPTQCALEIAANQNGYLLSFLDIPNGRIAHPRGLNSFGTITGSAAHKWQGPSQPCVWTKEGDLKFLDGLGGICGNANAINSIGIVAGTIEDESRNTHAAIWLPDLTHHDFGNDEYASGLTCINSTGYAGGYIYNHPTERGQLHQRPAIWQLSDATWGLIPFPPEHWGQVNCINSNNECLVSMHDEKQHVRTGIYNIREGTLNEISHRENGHIRPIAFTDEATIIGKFPTQPNKIVKFYLNSRTEIIDFGANYHVTYANEFFIVGWHMVDGYQQPWIFKTGENCKFLPYVKHHHTRAVAVNETGVILGVAQSDHCAHPIKWVPI